MTKIKSLREFKQYKTAYPLLDSLAMHCTDKKGSDTWRQVQYLRATILTHVDKMDEAQQILEDLYHFPDLTPAEKQGIESQMSIIRYYNEGDYKAGYDGLMSGLTDEEKSEFFNILDDEYSGIPTKTQFKRKEQLLVLAFSDERLAQVLINTGNQHLVHELSEYKKQYVTPRTMTHDDDSLASLFLQHNRFVKQKAASEARRILMHIGKHIESRQETPGAFNVDDMESYIVATIASNDLDIYLDQSEFFSPILIHACPKNLLKIKTVLIHFFNQLVRLAREKAYNVTPQRQRTEIAIRRLVINYLFSLLAELCIKLPDKSKSWLSYISELKQYWDFSGLRVQLQQQWFNYRAFQSTEKQLITLKLCEAVATIAITAQQREKQIAALVELNKHLFEFRKRTSGQFGGAYQQLPNELAFIDFSAITESRTNVVLTVLAKINNKWARFLKSDYIHLKKLDYFISLLRPNMHPRPKLNLEDVTAIHKESEELVGKLLPERFLTSPPKCIGLRNTGVLQNLPLEALSVKSFLKRYWLGAFTTTVTLTHTTLNSQFVEQSFVLQNLMLFANPHFAAPLPALHGSAKEADLIEKIGEKKGAITKNVQGFSANRDNFLSMSGTKAPQVLHIATHGIVDPEHNELSVMAVSCKDESGAATTPWIGFYDICLMDFRNTDLVILSTCSTHDGLPIMGESANSLAWAFKAAGAKAVIGTRWQVNDAAAREFWIQFYIELTEGKSIVDALTSARRTLIYSQKWAHPKYWAAYELIL